jgi:hypothetical protein
MKSSFIILSIDRQSYDYESLLTYLCSINEIVRLAIIENGFFLEYHYDAEEERKMLIKNILLMDVTDIQIYETLYKEFIPRSRINYFGDVS